MVELTHKEISSLGGKTSHKLHGKEIIARLHKNFERLTPEQKKAFMVGIRNGKTYAQIRHELGLDTEPSA